MRLTIKTELEYDRAIRHFRDVWRRERDRAGVTLEVIPFVAPITNPQMGRLRAIIRRFAYESDYRTHELEAWLVESFSPPTSETDPTPKPLDDYSKEEASAMIERVIQVAAEQGYSIQ